MSTVAIIIREGDYPVFTMCQAVSTHLLIFATAYKMLVSLCYPLIAIGKLECREVKQLPATVRSLY